MIVSSISSVNQYVAPTITEIAATAAARRTQEAQDRRATQTADQAARTAAAVEARRAAAEADDVRRTAAADEARRVAMAEQARAVDASRDTTQSLQARRAGNAAFGNTVDMYL